jgi:hypothetical protein
METENQKTSTDLGFEIEEAPHSSGKKAGATSFFSIRVKTGVSLWNMLALPYLLVINVAAGSYANT